MRFTVIALVDGQKIGGQSDATMREVMDLVHDERGPNHEFLKTLVLKGYAMTFDRYKVFPSDEKATTCVLVVYQNQ